MGRGIKKVNTLLETDSAAIFIIMNQNYISKEKRSKTFQKKRE